MSKQTQIKDNKKADCIRQDNQSASKTSHHNHVGNETMTSQIVPQTVTFNNQELITFEQNGVQYTAMKPICENIGIDWESQRQRIKRDDILSKVACMIKATGLDGKIYEMLSLPIQFLNGWLFGVDSKRVKTDEAKKNLMAYKLECYQVLHDYWHKGEAVNPRFEKITDKQAYQLKTAVEKRCRNNKEHYQTVWTALKHRFEVPKYTDILVKDFDIAMNLVWTIALPSAQERLAHPLDAYALTNLKALVTHNFLMVSFYKTIEQPIKALNPSLWSHTFEHFWSAKSLAIGFNNQFDLGVDERYLLPYRC